jgi:orotate phosphoribosyltransferase
MSHQIEQEITATTERLVALYLWHLGAVKVNKDKPFVLTSENYSPIYFNVRQLISSVSFMDLFAAASRHVLAQSHVEFDVVAGGETAGIPFAAFLARAFGKPMVYVRKAAKGHGIPSRVEGTVEPASRVLLVEDLITDAGSKLSFIQGIRDEGADVKNVLVVFDRLQGGREALKDAGIALHALTNLDTALSLAAASGFLQEDEIQAVQHYLRSPQQWHEERGLQFHER